MRNGIFLSLATIGILDSLYILYLEHFEGVCLAGSCTNVPAVFGLLWFATSPLAVERDKFRPAWTIAGLVGVVFLVSIELASGTFCPYCTIAHTAGLAMIAMTTLEKKAAIRFSDT
ncbi:vitamin K epoxide reductase family protein [Archaeoglobus veneficus]|uniref:Vitamin K epoxide reductase n=1 Tax=Archaeoglobus veneficus (strain DSM 11195 / SNP6) TaxID=693661 RepID=F2KPX1_ARCVS|nr:vitamin K epoxide reductase family protein [Archaeoglobus veneficus]AEA46478.1 Vitamin K epoxide reductase [Archaeoglobus veneficus SNP6]